MDAPPRPASPADAVACRGVGKTWAADTSRAHEALRAVDLDVAPGEFVALLGPSGCGKSTLLYLIAGLEAASAGELWSFGTPVETPSPQRSLIFQETSLYPWLSVWQNVGFGLSIRGVAAAERRALAVEALAHVGLAEAANKRPDELSGGMRPRVAVARALAMRPRVLLMDEPFAALDAITRDLLHDELERIWKETGRTIVFVTHNVREAVRLGQRVLLLSSRPGRVVEEWHVTEEHRTDAGLAGQLTGVITARLREEIRRHAK